MMMMILENHLSSSTCSLSMKGGPGERRGLFTQSKVKDLKDGELKKTKNKKKRKLGGKVGTQSSAPEAIGGHTKMLSSKTLLPSSAPRTGISSPTNFKGDQVNE